MTPRRARFGAFFGAGLAVTVAVAVLLGPRAASAPDGLERVAIDEGFADAEDGHALEGLPTAGYGIRGLGDGWGTAAAGLVGVAATFAAVSAVLRLRLRRSGARAAGPEG